MKYLPFIIALWTCSVLSIYAHTISENTSNPWCDNYEQSSILTNPQTWGVYNVHDPSCRKVGDYYYMYSTDVAYMPRHLVSRDDVPKMGFLQIRRSQNLVNWEFIGWAFDSIPQEGADWVASVNDGHGPVNIWAPYMIPSADGKTYHLYYCVSAFGKKTSAICLAVAPSPEGPWEHKGIVVKTDSNSVMNAIDPSVIATVDGKHWMHYGSYFGGIFCVEIDPTSGFTVNEGDQGHLVARRANYQKDNLEAPEILYVPELGRYYLFGSYDPLMTTYNVRVCRGENPQGPFIDYFGKQMADTTNNFPILTAPYKFENHPGWVGTGHCGVITDGEGHYFMAHQGRLASESQMMDLHLRQMFFTQDGWPVVSPERYTGTPNYHYAKSELAGEWEILRVIEPRAERALEAGQILWGEGDLLDGEWNLSSHQSLVADSGDWDFNEESQLMNIKFEGEEINNLIVFAGHDWEREHDTALFTGLDSRGRSVWGKKIK